MRRVRWTLRFGEYALFLGLPVAAFATAPSLLLLEVLAAWGLLLALYLVTRRWLASPSDPHWLMTEPGVPWQGLLGILGLWLTYLAFRLAGYGHGETDPVNLWFLLLVPLSLVSRYGRSQTWGYLLGLAISLQLITRLGLASIMDARPLWVASVTTVGGWPFPVPDPAYTTTLVQTAILLLAANGVHFAFRYKRMRDAHTHIAQEVAHQLSSHVSGEAGYIRAAELIHRLTSFPKDYFPYVHIMRWDECKRQLVVVGGAGKPQSLWNNVAVSAGEGITGAVFDSGDAKREGDVKRLQATGQYVCTHGYEDVQSELAVPIQSRGRTIGVLDVQSPRRYEFNRHDEALLNFLADGLAVVFGHELTNQRVAQAYQLAQDTLAAGAEARRLETWFEQVVSAARKHLGADHVSLFRLAPGTSYPLRTSLVWPKPPPEYSTRKYLSFPRGSRLWHLLQKWEPNYDVHFARDGEIGAEADLWATDYIDLARLRTVAFVPIGLDEPMAALFLGYRAAKSFGDVDQLALVTFGAALELTYRRVAPARANPDQLGSAAHIAVAPAYKIRAELESLAEAVADAPSETVRAALLAIREDVLHLQAQVKLATMGFGIDSTQPLSTLLENFAGQLQVRLHGRVSFQISGTEAVDDEEPVVITTLYKVICEAMLNAVNHGGHSVSQVTVRVERRSDELHVTVTDNGQGFPPQLMPSRGPGFYYWSHIIRHEFGGRLVHSDRAGGGTCITLRLPLCPWPQSEEQQ